MIGRPPAGTARAARRGGRLVTRVGGTSQEAGDGSGGELEALVRYSAGVLDRWPCAVP